MPDFKHHTVCRVCGTLLPPAFLSLGLQPLANNLPRPEDPPPERYPLDLHCCPRCSLVQLGVVVDPHILFDTYFYVPSASQAFHDHFREMAQHLVRKLHLAPGDLVCDIGSNDGLLLSYFAALGMRVVGVEPARNLIQQAAQRGVPTLNEYFDLGTRNRIEGRYGKPKLVTATNVLAHVDGVAELMHHAMDMLAPGGVLVAEVPGLYEMLRDGTWDLVYHEHLSYWFLSSLQALSSSLYDVEEVPTHGGSLRTFFGPYVTTHAFRERVTKERGTASLEDFSRRAQGSRDAFLDLVHQHWPVFGYGAPAKATVLVNYCGLSGDAVKFIVDDNPLKQGRLLPGTDIPIVHPSFMKEQREKGLLPETAVCFPWNVADDVMAKLRGYVRRVVVPMPEPRVVELPRVSSP